VGSLPEPQREEDYIASVAARGRGQRWAPIGLPKGLSRSLANGRSLNGGQWQAVTACSNRGNRVGLVEGPAGAGKSSMLGKFDEAATLAGEPVNLPGDDGGGGPRSSKKIVSTPYPRPASLSTKRCRPAARGGRVVIDESSMLGIRMPSG